ncbi:MAG: hypothetical protein MI748_10910 [Opitutales bacterium]|nr:hypothetical protein [Opitutales bacterium]
MILAKVIGNVTKAACHPGLETARVLICEVLDQNGNATGKVLGAGDWIGAGIGNEVMISADGDACQAFLKDSNTPLRNVVVGIVDSRGGKAI